MVAAENIVKLLGQGERFRRVKTFAELDAAVNAGFPRTALDSVLENVAPESERARLRNRVVPRATYQRSERLSPMHSAATERLARTGALARWLWEDNEKALLFLWKAHPELGGRRPIEAALTELGAREVEEIIERGIHGIPV